MLPLDLLCCFQCLHWPRREETGGKLEWERKQDHLSPNLTFISSLNDCMFIALPEAQYSLLDQRWINQIKRCDPFAFWECYKPPSTLPNFCFLLCSLSNSQAALPLQLGVSQLFIFTLSGQCQNILFEVFIQTTASLWSCADSTLGVQLLHVRHNWPLLGSWL